MFFATFRVFLNACPEMIEAVSEIDILMPPPLKRPVEMPTIEPVPLPPRQPVETPTIEPVPLPV